MKLGMVEDNPLMVEKSMGDKFESQYQFLMTSSVDI